MNLSRVVRSTSGAWTLFLLSAPIAAQTGREVRVMAPAVVGQTAAFALRHPVGAAGNSYAMLFATPTYPGSLQLQLPGLTILGRLRVDPASMVVVGTGVLDTSGRSPLLQLPVPNVQGLVGYTFDLQGIDIGGAAVLTFSDNDVEVVVANAPAANMVPIPAGTHQRGSNAPLGVSPYYNSPTSQPVHAVTITRPFWMARHEVTQAEWQAVMGANPSNFVGPEHPVENVTWHEAMAYCAARTVTERAAGRVPTGYVYRLPTEAEWEYCCRAGTTTEYSFGATISCAQANFGFNFHTSMDCSITRHTTVGSYPASPFGLFDMHGNVAEWCLDSWDGVNTYLFGAVSDPYDNLGALRVHRGGNWFFDSSACRSAARLSADPAFRLRDVGFRVVLAPVIVP